MECLNKIRRYATIGAIVATILTSCATTKEYNVMSKQDFLNKSNWTNIEGIKIYNEIYTSVMGLLGKITVEDGVEIPVKDYMNSLDLNKDGYITPQEFYNFRKDRGI